MKNIITKIIVFTIIVSMLISVAYPRQAKAADLVYTYWDLWYSLSSAANYSMQEKDGPFDGYDTAKLKDKAKAQFDDFKIWLQRAYMPVGITVDMLVNQADEMIANVKSTGLEISQELWDAFCQYFDDIANKKTISESYARSVDDLNSLVKSITSVDLNLKNDSKTQRFLDSDHMCIAKVEWDGGYQYRVVIPQDKCSFTGWSYYDYGGCKYLTHCNNYSHMYWGWIIYSDGSISCQNTNLYFNPTRENITPLVLDWSVDVGTISDVYSPFIDYTVVDACPQEVPEVIPWKVLPREITEEETKIKTNPPEDPDDDDKDKPAVIPPIHDLPNPEDTEQESETEEETEETDTNKKPKPPKPEDMNDINLLADLTEIFPFCIPFDISRALKALKKESGTAPQFIIPFQMKDLGINEKVVIDFADFKPLTKVIRSGVLVLYIIGLMWATSKVMKW